MNFAVLYLTIGCCIAALSIYFLEDRLPFWLMMFPEELRDLIEICPAIFWGVLFVFITIIWPFVLLVL